MPKKQEMDFERALARLEELVGQMESGELSLEEMMARFEEGTKLADVCAKRLDEVERRIEKLVRDKAGDLKEEPFGADEEA